MPPVDALAAETAPRRTQPSRLVRFVPWAVLGALLAVAVLLRPQQVRTTLTSPRALLVIAGVVAATMLLGRVTRRLPRPAGTALTLAPAAVACVLLVVPTLQGSEVDEELVGLAPATGGTAPEPATGAAATRLSTGEVEGIGHRGEGRASLVKLADGSFVLRFEDLDVDPGPDYRVHLVSGAGKESPGEGTDLGALKATSGNQNYPLPAAPPDGPLTALIWCRAFSVPIAAATLG